MAPLPEHGRKANAIADVVKVLLDYLGKEYEACTPNSGAADCQGSRETGRTQNKSVDTGSVDTPLENHGKQDAT